MGKIENKPWKDSVVDVLQATNKAMHYADIATEIQNEAANEGWCNACGNGQCCNPRFHQKGRNELSICESGGG